MDNNNIDMIINVIIVIIGFLFVFLYKQIGFKTADFYFKYLHLKFNVKWYQIGFLIIGIAFIIFGFLSFLDF
jgi:hypothetical protein